MSSASFHIANSSCRGSYHRILGGFQVGGSLRAGLARMDVTVVMLLPVQQGLRVSYGYLVICHLLCQAVQSVGRTDRSIAFRAGGVINGSLGFLNFRQEPDPGSTILNDLHR